MIQKLIINTVNAIAEPVENIALTTREYFIGLKEFFKDIFS